MILAFAQAVISRLVALPCRFCFATFDDTDKSKAVKELDSQLKVRGATTTLPTHLT